MPSFSAISAIRNPLQQFDAAMSVATRHLGTAIDEIGPIAQRGVEHNRLEGPTAPTLLSLRLADDRLAAVRDILHAGTEVDDHLLRLDGARRGIHSAVELLTTGTKPGLASPWHAPGALREADWALSKLTQLRSDVHAQRIFGTNVTAIAAPRSANEAVDVLGAAARDVMRAGDLAPVTRNMASLERAVTLLRRPVLDEGASQFRSGVANDVADVLTRAGSGAIAPDRTAGALLSAAASLGA